MGRPSQVHSAGNSPGPWGVLTRVSEWGRREGSESDCCTGLQGRKGDGVRSALHVDYINLYSMLNVAKKEPTEE